MIHLLPHWNWPGMEGSPIRVVAYTNCDHAALYLNGQLIAEQDVPSYTPAEWQVPYAPGRLEARGYRAGQLLCTDTAETSGAPVQLKLTLESDGVQADGQDVALLTCTCLDAKGRTVPDASPMVHFYTNERGSILGTGSDVCDHVPPQCPDRRMRAGRISVAVRAGNQPGKLMVRAEADGLQPAVLWVALS